MDENLRRRLLDMLEMATRARASRAGDPSVILGVNEEVKAVQNANAKALADIIDMGGWPDVEQAGPDGAAAAFLIVTQSIGLPRFMRACLDLIKEAAEAGRVPRWQMALLTDRICWLEGRPQVYGTQFDWTPAGVLDPLPIDDAANVDKRRAGAEIIPLAQGIAQRRMEAEQNGEVPPHDWAARQADFEAWTKAIGWRQ